MNSGKERIEGFCNNKLRTVRLPNSGCMYLGMRDDPETGELVVEYMQRPGIHMQVISDTGISIPEGAKVRYERVDLTERARSEIPRLEVPRLEVPRLGDRESGIPLDEISRSEDPYRLTREYVDRAVDEAVARGEKTFDEAIARGERGERDQREVSELAREIAEDLPGEPVPKDLSRFDYAKPDFIEAVRRAGEEQRMQEGSSD